MRRLHIALLALVLSAGVAMTAATSSAQDTWVVLPVGIAEAPSPSVQDFVEVSAAGIEASGETTVLQGSVLGHRLENSVSLPYEAEDLGQLPSDLAEADDEIVRALARGRRDDVVDRATVLLERARDTRLTLLRDEDSALHVGRICAYRVAAHLEGGEEQQASSRAAECLALVPGHQLDDRHTPPVRELYERVAAAQGALRITGSRDDRPGCALRVEGHVVGQTPGARVRLPEGEYRVQVECEDQPGRIHRVRNETAGVEVEVRASLDAAMRTAPPSLVYASPSQLELLPGDLAEAARRAEATHAYAIIQQASGALLRSYRIPPSGPAVLLGERTVEQTSDASRVRESATQLASSSLADPSSEGAVTRSGEGGGGIHPVGPILLGVGGATLIAGAILGGVALAETSSLETACPSRMNCSPELRDQYDSMRTLAGAADTLLIGGAVVAATGLVLTLVLQDGEDGSDVALQCGPLGCTARGRF